MRGAKGGRKQFVMPVKSFHLGIARPIVWPRIAVLRASLGEYRGKRRNVRCRGCRFRCCGRDGGAAIAARAQPAKDASQYSANVAIDWFQLDLQLIQQTPGFSPPVAARFRMSW